LQGKPIGGRAWGSKVTAGAELGRSVAVDS